MSCFLNNEDSSRNLNSRFLMPMVLCAIYQYVGQIYISEQYQTSEVEVTNSVISLYVDEKPLYL